MSNMKKTIPTLVGGAILLNPSVYALENAINTEDEKQQVEGSNQVTEDSNNDVVVEVDGDIVGSQFDKVEISVDSNKVEIVENEESVTGNKDVIITDDNKEDIKVEDIQVENVEQQNMDGSEENKNILEKEKITSNQKVMKVKVESASIRKDVATDSEVKGTLVKNSYVDVYEQSSSEGWSKINYKGEMLYVNTSDLVDVEVVYKESNKDGVVVRSGAGDSYSEFGTLSKGDRVKVYQKLDNGWSKIDYNSKISFVITSELSNSYILTDTIKVDSVKVYKTNSDTSDVLGEAKKDETLFIYEDLNGYYKVRFSADSFGYIKKSDLTGTTNSNTEKPQTGDMMIFSYMGAMGVSSLGIVAVNRKNKK